MASRARNHLPSGNQKLIAFGSPYKADRTEAHRKLNRSRAYLYAGGLRKCTWKAVGISYQQSKKLDPHQRFSLRIRYEETIHSFLHDVGHACSGLLHSGQSGKAS